MDCIISSFYDNFDYMINKNMDDMYAMIKHIITLLYNKFIVGSTRIPSPLRNKIKKSYSSNNNNNDNNSEVKRFGEMLKTIQSYNNLEKALCIEQ